MYITELTSLGNATVTLHTTKLKTPNAAEACLPVYLCSILGLEKYFCSAALDFHISAKHTDYTNSTFLRYFMPRSLNRRLDICRPLGPTEIILF